MSELMDGWELVVGLEVHAQMLTRTKLFSPMTAAYGAEPNTQVNEICAGLPGVLPVLNAEAVRLAVRAGLALECAIGRRSVFARKNYFYPDLPKGYQITQFDEPIATAGALQIAVPVPQRVRIRRIHLEEDAGKSIHDRFPGATAVDLNRTGVPLIEIVTEPDLSSPAAARAFLDRLKQTLEYLDVSDCDMEKGSLRVDANVSIRPPGTTALGTKTELKNMNSFSSVERGLEFEIHRQQRLVSAGGRVTQETLLWDASAGEARSMRSKEESHDYRYFPEPDLPPLSVSASLIARIAAELPELPAAKEERLQESYGLPAYDAAVLAADPALADWFEAVAQRAGDGKAASNWVMVDVLGWLNQRGLGIGQAPVTPDALAALIRMVVRGTISNTAGRRVFQLMTETGRSAAELVAEHGLAQVSDDGQLQEWVESVIARFPDEVGRYRAGEARLLGFLMGQLMKQSGGRADPKRASDLMRRKLDE
jgi:aspartyl-tRNA(Asn)/glutamyl-tRNA(Gln) amidotransferase subunit B